MSQKTVAYKLSDGVVLTKQGKGMKMRTVLPTALKIDRRNYDLISAARNAECELTSATFTARAKIGATLYLPAFGNQTPPMTVTCVAGKKTLTETVNAVNRTTEALQAQAAMHMLVGFGLVGAMITAGQADARDKSADIYGYPSHVSIGG